MLKKAHFSSIPTIWWVVIAAIPAVIHLLLSLQTLSFSSFYLDEAYSVFYCQQPLENFHLLMEREVNPPFYFLTLTFWMKLFGDAEAAVRSLSLVFSVATVFTLTLFGRRFFHPLTGLFAALLFCFSEAHFRIGHEARAYAMFGFFTVISFWIFLAGMEKPSKKNSLGLGLINALLLYTHLVGIFVLMSQFLAFLFWKNKPAKAHLHYWISQAGAAILVVPMLFYLSAEKIGATSIWLESPTADQLITLPAVYFYFEWIVYVGLALVIFVAITGKKKFDSKFQLLTFWGVASILAAFVISQGLPMFLPKYLLFAGMGLFLLFSEATLRLRVSLPIKMLPLLVLVGMFAWNCNYHPTKGEDWRKAVALTTAMQNEGTGIIVMPGFQYRSWAYYSNKEAFRDFDSTVHHLYQDQTYFVDVVAPELFDHIDHESILLVVAKSTKSNEALGAEALLEKRYRKISNHWMEGIHIMEFRK